MELSEVSNAVRSVSDDIASELLRGRDVEVRFHNRLGALKILSIRKENVLPEDAGDNHKAFRVVKKENSDSDC